MKEFYTARELAGSPGLPGSTRRVSAKAIRNAWQSQARVGRGGGREYHVNDLPEDTREYLIAQSKKATFPLPIAIANEKIINETVNHSRQTARETALSKTTCLSGTAQKRMDAKIFILHLLAETDGSAGAIESFVAGYNAGSIDLPGWIKTNIKSVSYPTLIRWRSQLKKDGPARLAGAFGKLKGQTIIDKTPELTDFIVACVTDYPQTSCKQVYNGLKARFDAKIIPGKRAVERWINRWKIENRELFTAINNPDEWKNKFMVAFGSYSDNVIRPNQLWEMDSSPADVMLVDGRHTLLAVLDVYPRRAKIVVSKTSKATAIASLTRKALLDWGVPETIKRDNGQDYVSHHVTRIIHSLEIRTENCNPFSPWEKPHVERFFKTFAHGLAELHAGFIGHNVPERQAIEARQSFADRLMKKGKPVEINTTAKQLQIFCDRWVESIYSHQKHGSLKGKSPFEIMHEWEAPVARITNERALDVLLNEAPGDGTRVVSKKGVHLDNYTYIHEELAGYIGQRVRVLYDPVDMGLVYIFAGADLDYLCIAECPEVTGVSRKEVAEKTKKKQRQLVQTAKAELKKAAKKVDTKNIVEEILAYHERKNNVAQLPCPSVAYDSAGLIAASKAVDAIDFINIERAPAPVNDAAKEWVEKQMQETEPGETPEERWKYWKELESKAPGEISKEDLEWKNVYESLSEYRGRKMAFEDSDDAASGY